MKKILLVIAFFYVSAICFGQERVNRVHIAYDAINQNKLTNAIEWNYYSYSGQWSSLKNSRTTNSFGSIQSKSITIDGIKYIIFCVETKHDGYRYPEIKVDYFKF